MLADMVDVYKNGKDVLLFNRRNSGSVKISEFVYDLIKDMDDVSQIESLSSSFDAEDKRFLNELARVMKKFNILYHGASSNLRQITLAITDFCNLNCTHCCYSAHYINPQKAKAIICNMDIIERIVELRPMGVSITGGEPLLVRNLREVLEYLFEHFSNGIGLATNATLINEENVVWLCELVSSFDISIDGINSATCDAIRGAGTFDKVISAIKLIKKHTNKEIILSMVTDNETDKNSDAFIAMCKELDVTPRIRTMNLVGRAKDNHIDSDEIVEFMRASTANLVASYDCPGGTKELFVNSKGDVYPCPLFAENEYKVGTIFDRDLTEKLTWNKQLDWFKAFSEYIPDTRTECETCEVRSFCWNCPALAKSYMENNEIAALRSICADKQRALHEVLWNA